MLSYREFLSTCLTDQILDILVFPMLALSHQRMDFVVRDQIVVAIGIRTELVSGTDHLFFSLFCFSSRAMVQAHGYTLTGAVHQIDKLSDIADNPFHSSVSARAALEPCLTFFELVNHFKIDLDKNIINEG